MQNIDSIKKYIENLDSHVRIKYNYILLKEYPLIINNDKLSNKILKFLNFISDWLEDPLTINLNVLRRCAGSLSGFLLEFFNDEKLFNFGQSLYYLIVSVVNYDQSYYSVFNSINSILHYLKANNYKIQLIKT